MKNLIEKIPGFYEVYCLDLFRKTPGVLFDALPMENLSRIDAIDRVLHQSAAHSPGPVNGISRPWYMHQYQDDHLIVLSGERHIELYSSEYRRVETFTITPHALYRNGELIYDGGAVLMWPRYVFHRIVSGDRGSASINLAKHYDDFDFDTNFDIYELNTETGSHRVIRKGSEDQKGTV